MDFDRYRKEFFAEPEPSHGLPSRALFPSESGGPVNAEMRIVLETPEVAERMQSACIEACGTGWAPSDQLMYEPLRSRPVTDPFGTSILILSRRL